MTAHLRGRCWSEMGAGELLVSAPSVTRSAGNVEPQDMGPVTATMTCCFSGGVCLGCRWSAVERWWACAGAAQWALVVAPGSLRSARAARRPRGLEGA
jgi:hypothetical protein